MIPARAVKTSAEVSERETASHTSTSVEGFNRIHFRRQARQAAGTGSIIGASMVLGSGSTLGPYTIAAELGHGGMGIVYTAQDPRLKRQVAIKLLPPDLTRDETAKQRFLQEAQAASALDHPNICNIYEINETDHGQL